MKTVAIVKSFEQAKDICDLVDAYILPIKDYSINFQNVFCLDEVEKFKVLNREIFLCMNKNIHNNEVDGLREVLTQIPKMGINGIIYYDIAFVNLKSELDLDIDFIWAQEHMVTNYGTINYWHDKGIRYAYLSSELTKEEITEIIKNSHSKLFMNVFGYIPMFTSRRHLVKNYLDYFNLESENINRRIYKEDKHYPIYDGVYGTTVYSDYILNILNEDLSELDYIVFNSLMISDSDFKEVLYNYKNNVSEYKFPFNSGFLYKNVVYRVKKND